MKVFTVRRAITNAATATTQGQAVRQYLSYGEASAEVDRIYKEKSIETYITVDPA